MKVIDKIALVLIIIGAINWGLIAIFNFDLVAALFGDMSVISRIVYGLVGISGFFVIIFPRVLAPHVQYGKSFGHVHLPVAFNIAFFTCLSSNE